MTLDKITPIVSGVLPHVPRMLPVLISDPEMRERVAETFTSEEFINNIESYFVQNIKVSLATSNNGRPLLAEIQLCAFNHIDFNIRYWRWNSIGCLRQTCPPMVPLSALMYWLRLVHASVLNSTCNVLVACASNKAKTHVEMHSGQTAAVINEPISNLFYRI